MMKSVDDKDNVLLNEEDFPDVEQKQSCYVLFHSHTDGLALYAALKKIDIPARISPTPRMTSARCGISLLVNPADRDEIASFVDREGLRIDRMVMLDIRIDPKRDRFC